jgi:L-idonate 5-dehydrogenase
MTLACTLHGMLDLRLQEETPPAPGPHDVLLRLGAGGICGSDLHYFQHGRVGAFVIREPLIPGHEASGVVRPWAARSRASRPGDKVAVNPSHACGHCDYCRGGRFNLCRRMFFLGSASVFPHVQGMFRERFVMGEAQLTPVDEDMSLGEIACAEPLSIGLHALHRAGPAAGQDGAGHRRRHHRLHVRAGGAPGRRGRVIVCDIADRALRMARRWAPTEAVRSDQVAPGRWPTSPTSPSRPPAARVHFAPA